MPGWGMKKFLGWVVNIAFAVILLCLVVIVFFAVKGKVEGGVPSVAGHGLYVVLSGSMSPVFDAGSVIAVKDIVPEEVQVGDIITYRSEAGSDTLITHRVMEVIEENGQTSFITRGDANDADDPAPIPGENLVGQAVFWVPYAGYLVDFAKTKQGLLLLVIIPGMLFIINEMRNLWRYAREYEEEEKRKKALAEAREAGADM